MKYCNVLWNITNYYEVLQCIMKYYAWGEDFNELRIQY